MSKLSDYRLLSFDVYGTLIDWETGMFKNLRPLTDQKPEFSRAEVLKALNKLEKAQQEKTPDMLYPALLTTIYSQLAAEWGLKEPSMDEAEAFGKSIGQWPAFSDSVDALQRLSKHYKLVVLSNVDRESFGASNRGPLSGVKFDRIITAQDVGSYKPNLRNFEYMLKIVKEEFGIEKEQVLQTAQSQHHDHFPARKMGIKSAWIERGATVGNLDEPIFDWKFRTLGEMADALEKELGEKE
jgi:2-haloalkanoic acid dehalogenase type II